MQIITRDFELAWDFRSVACAATLVYNAQRAACSGLVWGGTLGIVVVFLGDVQGAVAFLLLPLLMPVYWLLMLPVAYLARAMAKHFPAASTFNRFAGVLIAAGDPLLCLIKVAAPKLVPMERPPLFSAQMLILLLKPAEAAEWITSRHGRR